MKCVPLRMRKGESDVSFVNLQRLRKPLGLPEPHLTVVSKSSSSPSLSSSPSSLVRPPPKTVPSPFRFGSRFDLLEAQKGNEAPNSVYSSWVSVLGERARPRLDPTFPSRCPSKVGCWVVGWEWRKKSLPSSLLWVPVPPPWIRVYVSSACCFETRSVTKGCLWLSGGPLKGEPINLW